MHGKKRFSVLPWSSLGELSLEKSVQVFQTGCTDNEILVYKQPSIINVNKRNLRSIFKREKRRNSFASLRNSRSNPYFVTMFEFRHENEDPVS